MKAKSVILIILSCILLCLPLFTTACDSNGSQGSQELSVLPPPEPDGGPFGVDLHINVNTIDDFLTRPDVSYFDVRMFYDPAEFEAIGGIANLTQTLPGYRIVPFPFLGTLSAMPVSGAYEGETLFEVVWGEGHEILELKPNYLESELILREIFPRDKVIFLMCGGGGYSALTRSLLVHQGWDENMIYNTGGNWHYDGNMAVDLTISSNNTDIATWRGDYASIDFSNLQPIAP